MNHNLLWALIAGAVTFCVVYPLGRYTDIVERLLDWRPRQKPTPTVTARSAFDPNIMLGHDGLWYGFRRHIIDGRYSYDTVPLGDGSDVEAMAETTGIPIERLRERIRGR